MALADRKKLSHHGPPYEFCQYLQYCDGSEQPGMVRGINQRSGQTLQSGFLSFAQATYE